MTDKERARRARFLLCGLSSRLPRQPARLRNLRASGAAFNRSKRFVYVATALGFLVWFLAAVLGAGIFIALDDRDLTG